MAVSAPRAPTLLSPLCAARPRCIPWTHAYGRRFDRRLGTGVSGVSLLVEPNDGVKPLVKALNRAQNTIMVSTYILSQHLIVRALERAAAQGVAVYVLLDHYPFGIVGQPQTEFSLLRSAGVSIKWTPSYFQYSHAKFIVLDDQTLIVSSANFSQSGFTVDRDFLVFDSNPKDVREADNIFRADWDRIPPVLNDPNLLVSPVNARGKIYQLVGRATRTVDLYTEEVLDTGAVRQLAAAARRGVQVHILTPTVSTWARQQLQGAGAEVRLGTARGSRPYVHAKVIVVDHRLAFIGSENLSSTSLDDNRELGVLIRQQSVVSRLEAVFASDWRAR